MAPLRFVLGGMLALCAVILLFSGQIFTAIFWAFTAVVLFPPALNWLEKKERHRLKTWQKYVLVFVSFSLGSLTFNPPPTAKRNPEQKQVAPVAVHDTVKVTNTNPPPLSPPIATKKTKKAKPAASSNDLAPAPQQYNIEIAPAAAPAKTRKKANSANSLTISPATTPKKVKKAARPRGCSYNGNPLYVGPRGGCYYLTGSGRKEYVDRSYCSGCY